MKSPQICRITVAALFAVPVAAAAGVAWFDNAPSSGFGAGAWMPKYAAFAIDIHRSAESVADPYVDEIPGDTAVDALRVFSAMGHDFPRDTALFDSAAARAEGLVGYQLTVSAGHGAAMPLFSSTPALTDTRTTVSLTSRWQAAYHPRITGSVFVGGESTSPESYRALGRRYYGLAVGGELTLARAHTPYVSFQMQRGLSAGDDALVTTALDDDRSQIAAGWKWQAQRHLSLQAGASLGYNGSRLRLQGSENARVFFGTRFDFR